MIAQRIWLAVAGSAAGWGALAAYLPEIQRVECRELAEYRERDPSPHNFLLGQVIDPAVPTPAAHMAILATIRTTFRTVTASIHETGMPEMTIPLGTVPLDDVE